MEKKGKRLLLGCTGSVASLKLPELVREFAALGFEMQVIVTEHARHFFDVRDVGVKILTDEDEWSLWSKRGDPVLHIELGKWADAFLIAPLDANTLAKLSAVSGEAGMLPRTFFLSHSENCLK